MNEKEQRDVILSLRCVPMADLQALLNYLETRPFVEVHGIIKGILRTATVEHLLKEANLTLQKQATA